MNEMEAIAKRVREMRDRVKRDALNRGICLQGASTQSYYMNGKIMGLTEVLTLIDPDPYN